ncbi:hypothetical protein Tco_0471035 [Tanacetum coccineum]
MDLCHHGVLFITYTPADQRLRIVSFNLEGAAAEWFRWMSRNGLITTWDSDAFSFARITEARLDDQAALVTGTSAKTFGNNGGADSESSGPVTPTDEVVGSGHSSTLFSLVEHGSSRSLQLWERIDTSDVQGLMYNEGSHNFVQSNAGERVRL